MCQKVVDYYPRALKYVLDYNMTQGKSEKAVDTYLSTLLHV